MLNLRTYNRYSLKYSIADLKELIKLAKEDGDKYFVTLDKGNIHSTIALAKECANAGIIPIQGLEILDNECWYATTPEGLKALNIASTIVSKDPTIDVVPLLKDGIKVLLGNLDRERILQYVAQIGKTNVFIELQYNDQFNPEDFKDIRHTALELDLKCIPTCKVLYTKQEHAIGHDYFHNYIFGDDAHLESDIYYCRNRQDFLQLPFEPEEINNLDHIFDGADMKVVIGQLKLPVFDKIPKEFNSDHEYLESLVIDGLKEKKIYDKQHIERINKELKDVKDANLASYFLIEKDICDFARKNGIFKGKGRGSGAGALICYALGITGIDPLEYGLIWERFYNIGRKGSLPDIDTDFEAERREEVIQYIIDRWGSDRVFQIVTFNALAPKKAIKSALNLAQCSFEEQNKVSDLVWHKAETIDEAIEHNPKLKEEAERRRLIFMVAKQYEGAYEAFGKHAAGIIIAKDSYINGALPMMWHPDDSRYISGYDLESVDAYGLLKMDILGINTLNIVKRAEQLIRKKNPTFSINEIDINDRSVYENIFHTGRTKCIFQLESSIGQKYSELLKPNNISDLADLITVIRPGAMEPGNTDLYLKVRSGEQEIEYPHPKLKEILDETYSACIYQEQVIKICQVMAGMDLQKADKVRAAAGKKKKKEMDALQPEFIKGCLSNNVTQEVADLLWSWIVKFSGYGFNKSHAVSYAFLSYDTAYLKYYYPTEFFEACCNYTKGDLHRTEFEKLNEIINDARLFNIQVVPPDFRRGNRDFEIVGERKIAYGLYRIKDIGEEAINQILKINKECDNFYTFLNKMILHKFGKKMVIALISSGALDCFRITRNQMLADYELIHELTDKEIGYIVPDIGNDKSIAQAIDDVCDEQKAAIRKELDKSVPNIKRRAKLREVLDTYKRKDKYETIYHLAILERMFLGVDLSVNETDGVSCLQNVTHNCLEIKNLPRKTKVRTILHVEKIREILTKKGKNPGQEMAFLTAGDGTYSLDNIVVFPTQYTKFKTVLQPGRIIYVEGAIGDTGGLIANSIGVLK